MGNLVSFLRDSEEIMLKKKDSEENESLLSADGIGKVEPLLSNRQALGRRLAAEAELRLCLVPTQKKFAMKFY